MISIHSEKLWSEVNVTILLISTLYKYIQITIEFYLVIGFEFSHGDK